MKTVRSSPEAFGLTTIGEIDWSDGEYRYAFTVLWRRDVDRVFVTGDDSGCSCPIPFDGTDVNSLESVYTLVDLRARLTAKHNPSSGWSNRPDRTVEIDRLLTLAREAGLR